MDNMEIYNKVRAVPKEAQKTILAGKLKGKTDINPMWRIKTLCENFGMCGFGWTTRILDHWVETADGETAAWVTIELKVKHPETGEWSQPIIGIGGSKQSGKGQGDGINDEAFKMAETDAISVACKKLGMGADIYWDADKTKYSVQSKPAPAGNTFKDAQSYTDHLNEALFCLQDVKSYEELKIVWDQYKPTLGEDKTFVDAIKGHPCNNKKNK